ncbi:MAG: hypothetical protein ACYS9Y_13365 [Planctomycetota bacterium]|jgi:hypothetical protein
MAQITYQEFFGYLEEWIAVNESKIASMWPQKGGWEGWAQAEIKTFIVGKDSTYDILREQHVYTSHRESVDFLLNDSFPVSQKAVIEFKCQSFENYKNFKKGLENDINKLTNELKPSYKGAVLFSIGIYFTDHPDIPEYFDKKVLGSGEVGICWAKIKTAYNK